jgi:hypothetical protein
MSPVTSSTRTTFLVTTTPSGEVYSPLSGRSRGAPRVTFSSVALFENQCLNISDFLLLVLEVYDEGEVWEEVEEEEGEKEEEAGIKYAEVETKPK